jgi:hypothetical protein
MKEKSKISHICLFILAICLTGCAVRTEPPYIKEDKVYGITKGIFRDRWWNYYERGISFAEGEFWLEAVDDFDKAIKKRYKDQWRARSYGMHFWDYFPHREKGIACYHLGRYLHAIEELEQSIGQAPSAKSKFYLNKARKGYLEQTRMDKQPPRITITSHSKKSFTNNFKCVVAGMAEDDFFVSSICINESPIFIELSKKRMPFKREIHLKRGLNKVQVMASDLVGKTSQGLIEIGVDPDGPTVIFDRPSYHRDLAGRIKISGYIYDATEIEEFKIDGECIEITEKKESSFSRTFSFPEEKKIVSFLARDKLGNVTRGEIQISSARAEIMVASLKLSGLFGLRDTQPPFIRIKGMAEYDIVNWDRIPIEVNITDENNIIRILVNGEPVLRKKGKNILFNHVVKLKEGKNQITIEATDSLGNSSTEILEITRIIPKARHISSRMTLSVLPFEKKGLISPLTDVAYDHLISAFVSQRRFQIIERAKLEEVLREQKLSSKELVDPARAVRLGRIIAAEGILVCAIHEDKKYVEIVARLIDTETSTIMVPHDVYDEDKSPARLRFLMDALALKFKCSFPLVEGLILKKERQDIYADLGSEDRVLKYMKYVIFRERKELTDSISKKAFAVDTEILGEARVNETGKDYSKARVLKGECIPKIRIHDKVITK